MNENNLNKEENLKRNNSLKILIQDEKEAHRKFINIITQEYLKFEGKIQEEKARWSDLKIQELEDHKWWNLRKKFRLKKIKKLENKIRELEKDKLAKEKLENKIKELKYLTNIKNISPENLSIKSPLTIFHASWGLGKTFFIEELVLWFERNRNQKIKTTKEKKTKEKKQSNVKKEIKKIYVINLWEHIYKETDVIKEFSRIIRKVISYALQNKWQKFCFFFQFWKFLWWMTEKSKNSLKSKNLWGKSVHFILNIFYKLSSNQKLIHKLSLKMDKTIVVLDNIERLENLVPEVIKIIQLYSSFSNFIFVLPMNKNAIKFGDYVNNYGEDAIDKFNTLGVWFDFKPNYRELLNKYQIPNNIIPKIIQILNQEKSDKNNNKYVLTIRELQKLLNTHYSNIYNWGKEWKEKKYNFYWLFDKKIWPNNLIKGDVSWFMWYVFKYDSRDNGNIVKLSPDNPVLDEIIELDENYKEVVDWFKEWLKSKAKEDALKEKNNTINFFQEKLYEYIYDEIETKYNKITNINKNAE